MKALQKNGYVAFFNGERKEVFAFTQYAAQQIAAEKFKLKKSEFYKVAIALAQLGENPGAPVIHNGAILAGA